MADPKPSLLRSILYIPFEIVVGLFVILDGIVRPVFRPVVRWLSSLRLVQRLERSIASMPPYLLLALLVVPFGFAELAKVYAVVLMSEAHFKTGMTIFILAYVVSIFVCERTFHAGKKQLLTIPWFAKLYGMVIAIKDHILGWFRKTWVWKKAGDLRQSLRIAFRRFKSRLPTFSRKPISRKQRGFVERS